MFNIGDIVHSSDGELLYGKIIGTNYIDNIYSIMWDEFNSYDDNHMHGWDHTNLLHAEFDEVISGLCDV